MTDDNPSPDELDDALAFAYGEGADESLSPSVIDRIGEVTGETPGVSLRDEESHGTTPLLRPLAAGERREAGKYVVQGELGRGGVGSVHKGHDQDLGRDVALKFLHEKYRRDPALLHRFVEEAQIGGQLQHPGIVPVYDLGMVDGKPFFSMKLVKGQTLAKKLADRESIAADRREFLVIFEDVCQTLAYAHARGVVHRDLKPANIMIGSFGEVQVVDWGMGKVLQHGGVADEAFAAKKQAALSVIETVRSAGHGSQSIVGSVMGTPAYMPPEQARGDVEAMDERSDVFALGAILCEILTGAPPYVGEPDELISMAAMGKTGDAHARLAACGAEPEMVELATRCLMPAPAARPKSAAVVAEVVHQHLAAAEARVHEARVEAAEAEGRAAALKRTQVLGAGLLAAIAAGLLLSLWFWREADRAAASEGVARAEAEASAEVARENERRAVEQTAIAERELARAVEIKNLITEMLEGVKPEAARDSDITLLKGNLDAASERLASGFIQDPLIAAELHYLCGTVYLALALLPNAEVHLERSLAISDRVLEAEDPRRLHSLSSLGRLETVQGRYDEAEPRLLEAVRLGERVFGADSDDALNFSASLGELYFRQHRFAEAEAIHLRVLREREATVGPDHPDTVAVMGSLANDYDFQGRGELAAPLLERALEITLRLEGETSPTTLVLQANLARVYENLGRYEESEELTLRTLELLERVHGVEHITTLTLQLNLALLYRAQGRHAESSALLLETLEIQNRFLGEEHPDTLITLHNVAVQHLREGRLAEAEALCLRTLEARKRTLGEEHRLTLSTQALLADVYLTTRRFAEAEALLTQQLAIEERTLGEEHLETQQTSDRLANVYRLQGRVDDLLALLVPKLEVQRRTLGADHESTLGTATNLGMVYLALKRFEDAAALLEINLPTMRRVLGPYHAWTGYAQDGLLTAYEALGREEDARPLRLETLEREIAAAEAEGASAEALNAAAWTLLTSADESLRDPARALVLAERACALGERTNSSSLWGMLDTLALAQHRTGDSAAAVETQRRALAFPPPPAALEELRQHLAEFEAAASDG